MKTQIGSLFKAMLSVAALGMTTNVFAATVALPPIPESGYPSFENSVQITVTKKWYGYELVATGDAKDIMFDYTSAPGGAYAVSGENEKFVTKAYLRPDGTMYGDDSYVKITGKLVGVPGPDPSGTLFSAELSNAAWNSSTIGFSTTDFGGWAAQFGTDESLYFTDFNRRGASTTALTFPGFGSGFCSVKNPAIGCTAKGVWQADARALTTVPVPAAVWLLGSGLIGLMSIGRRSVKEVA
jgi:hypothetical protein